MRLKLRPTPPEARSLKPGAWCSAPLLLVVLAVAAALAASPLAAGQTPSGPYRVLITNDDGVFAPGILALAQALGSLGEITIVAPDVNQSGKGHSISFTDPIYADPVTLPGGIRAVAVTATPASCVKVAIGAIMRERPHLVVSGINRGVNLGMIAYVSGTVGAAREAALQGVPAIAASLDAVGHPNYEPGARAVRQIAELVKTRGLPSGVFLNVNIPAGPPEAIRGIRVTTQSALAGRERYEERKSPRGRRYFWNIFEEPASDAEGTDVWATANGFVAVTPLKVGEFDAKTFEGWKSAFK